MLDLNSRAGFGSGTRQIRGQFTSSQPTSPHITSGFIVYFTHLPHRSVTVSASERGAPLDISANI